MSYNASYPGYGTFVWPHTQIGTRVHARCPYSVENATYGILECLLRNEAPAWENPNVTMCPKPYLHRWFASQKSQVKAIASICERCVFIIYYKLLHSTIGGPHVRSYICNSTQSLQYMNI